MPKSDDALELLRVHLDLIRDLYSISPTLKIG